jgi:hypothetical protein
LEKKWRIEILEEGNSFKETGRYENWRQGTKRARRKGMAKKGQYQKEKARRNQNERRHCFQ